MEFQELEKKFALFDSKLEATRRRVDKPNFDKAVFNLLKIFECDYQIKKIGFFREYLLEETINLEKKTLRVTNTNDYKNHSISNLTTRKIYI